MLRAFVVIDHFVYLMTLASSLLNCVYHGEATAQWQKALRNNSEPI